MALTITTNNVPRELTMGQWLDGFGGLRPDSLYHKLGREFNHLSREDFDITQFFKYRENWYHLGEFMNCDKVIFPGWDGYHPETAFSGIIVKNLFDSVIVGRYSC